MGALNEIDLVFERLRELEKRMDKEEREKMKGRFK